jgi:hypothetical protein
MISPRNDHAYDSNFEIAALEVIADARRVPLVGRPHAYAPALRKVPAGRGSAEAAMGTVDAGMLSISLPKTRP